MSVMNVYLARHGETEFNRNNQIQGRGIDASLNETGIRQAHAIADYLKAQRINRIFSSSLQRSQQTAKVIASYFDLGVEPHRDLDEMNFGVLEGRPISEISEDLELLHNTWKSGNIDFASEEGESPNAVLQRAHNRINQINREQQHSNLLFVLHGRLIRILLSHWLKYGLSAMHRVPHSNGALYQLKWDGQTFEPVFIHKTDHLKNVEVEG